MNREVLTKYKDSRLKIHLENNYHYTCFILNLYDNAVELEDKFGDTYLFSYDTIDRVEVLEEDMNDGKARQR